jgi:hypothetical protein
MSTEIPSRSPSSHSRRKPAWMNAYTDFAAAIMLVLGLWQVLAGLTAVVGGGGLYVTPSGYTYSFSVAGWGWVVLLLGVLIAGVDVVVLLGRRWGDTGAIVLASLSMIANFVVIPFYPIWSLVIIALNAALIWALTTHGRNVT